MEGDLLWGSVSGDFPPKFLMFLVKSEPGPVWACWRVIKLSWINEENEMFGLKCQIWLL